MSSNSDTGNSNNSNNIQAAELVQGVTDAALNKVTNTTTNVANDMAINFVNNKLGDALQKRTNVSDNNENNTQGETTEKTTLVEEDNNENNSQEKTTLVEEDNNENNSQEKTTLVEEDNNENNSQEENGIEYNEKIYKNTDIYPFEQDSETIKVLNKYQSEDTDFSFFKIPEISYIDNKFTFEFKEDNTNYNFAKYALCVYKDRLCVIKSVTLFKNKGLLQNFRGDGKNLKIQLYKFPLPQQDMSGQIIEVVDNNVERVTGLYENFKKLYLLNKKIIMKDENHDKSDVDLLKEALKMYNNHPGISKNIKDRDVIKSKINASIAKCNALLGPKDNEDSFELLARQFSENKSVIKEGERQQTDNNNQLKKLKNKENNINKQIEETNALLGKMRTLHETFKKTFENILYTPNNYNEKNIFDEKNEEESRNMKLPNYYSYPPNNDKQYLNSKTKLGNFYKSLKNKTINKNKKEGTSYNLDINCYIKADLIRGEGNEIEFKTRKHKDDEEKEKYVLDVQKGKKKENVYIPVTDISGIYNQDIISCTLPNGKKGEFAKDDLLSSDFVFQEDRSELVYFYNNFLIKDFHEKYNNFNNDINGLIQKAKDELAKIEEEKARITGAHIQGTDCEGFKEIINNLKKKIKIFKKNDDEPKLLGYLIKYMNVTTTLTLKKKEKNIYAAYDNSEECKEKKRMTIKNETKDRKESKIFVLNKIAKNEKNVGYNNLNQIDNLDNHKLKGIIKDLIQDIIIKDLELNYDLDQEYEVMIQNYKKGVPKDYNKLVKNYDDYLDKLIENRDNERSKNAISNFTIKINEYILQLETNEEGDKLSITKEELLEIYNELIKQARNRLINLKPEGIFEDSFGEEGDSLLEINKKLLNVEGKVFTEFSVYYNNFIILLNKLSEYKEGTDYSNEYKEVIKEYLSLIRSNDLILDEFKDLIYNDLTNRLKNKLSNKTAQEIKSELETTVNKTIEGLINKEDPQPNNILEIFDDIQSEERGKEKFLLRKIGILNDDEEIKKNRRFFGGKTLKRKRNLKRKTLKKK
jgi:hypothetical protein